MSHGPVILATASHDHMIRFWEPQSGRCYRTIFYPDMHVNRLEITPDKRFLAAACNPHIRLFDINSNEPHKPVMTYESHTNNVMAIGFQNDGNMMYSGSEDGTIKIWDTRAPDCQKEYENLDSQKEDDQSVVSDSQKEDDQSVVRDSQKEDDQSVVRDVPKKKMYRSMGCQKEYENVVPVNTVVLHPNQNELISGDQNGTIRVWDLRADACTCELVPEFDTPLRSLSVMWDGTMVVAANDRGTCYIWRALPGTQMRTEYQPLHKLQAHNKRVLKCLLSPENKYLATASSDKTVKIWNVDGFKLEKVLKGHERWVWDCDFSVDGEFLLTASSDTTARLWSMREGKELKLYQGHRKATVCCVLRD